jgi:methionine-rich copper-binding protein CopC
MLYLAVRRASASWTVAEALPKSSAWLVFRASCSQTDVVQLMTRLISAGLKAVSAVLCLGLLVPGLLVAGPAAAHAILMESVPAVNGTAQGPEIAFDLRFNTRIDHKRSRLTLIRSEASQQVLPIDRDGADDHIATRASLPPGTYTLRWQVLAVDGHITRGDVPFTVGSN